MFGRLHLGLRLAFRSWTRNAMHEATRIRSSGWIRRGTIPLLSAGYLYYIPLPVSLAADAKPQPKPAEEGSLAESNAGVPRRSILHKIWRALIHIIRFFHLLIIFAPPILLFPLMFFKKTEDYWRDLFVKAVERAGVVFIKAFQYLSHRRDIIGP
jgi:hypothetical protein